MRYAGEWFRRKKWAIVLAASAHASLGCAEIVGIEPWKPADPCEQPDIDPETCLPKGACAECLYVQHATCEAARMDCRADPVSVCNTISTCAAPCEKDADPLACIGGCCTTNAGDTKYDVYLTCVCDACKAECGSKVMGCDALCDPTPP